MNTVLGIMLVLAVVGLMAACLVKIGAAPWQPRCIRLANIAEGTHATGKLNKRADAAITTRHLLYKVGTDIDHIAVAGATDLALGTVDDEVATADIGDTLVTVNLLGKGGGTKRMVASEAITAGARVYQAAGGKVASTGTRCVGRALIAAAADGDPIEVDDQPALPNPAGRQLVYAGIHTWAGGAGTTNAATVTGTLTSDEIIATPIAVAGAGLLQKAVPTADTVTFTTSANFANGDKIAYQVWRAA